jgi:hypothetical protein
MLLCADPAGESPRILPPADGGHSRPFSLRLLLLSRGRKPLGVFVDGCLRHHKNCRHDVEGFSQLIQCSERQIFFCPLDGPHIRAVQVALDRKLLLRPAAGHSESSHDDGDDVNRHRLAHVRQRPVQLALALQGIPSICKSRNIFVSLRIGRDVKDSCWFCQCINRIGLSFQNQVAASPMRGRFRQPTDRSDCRIGGRHRSAFLSFLTRDGGPCPASRLANCIV